MSEMIETTCEPPQRILVAGRGGSGASVGGKGGDLNLTLGPGARVAVFVVIGEETAEADVERLLEQLGKAMERAGL